MEKKKKFEFPHTYVILLCIIAVMTICTHIIPAGQYERVFNETANRNVVDPNSFAYVDPSPVGFFEFLHAIPNGMVEMAQPRSSFGSTDLGNVSLCCPAAQPMFDITGDPSIAGHTKAMADCTQTPYGQKAMEQAACTMAFTALRVLTDPELLARIWEEFRTAEK